MRVRPSETVLVCGSRGWDEYLPIRDRLAVFVDSHATVLHGAANGADAFAGTACIELGLNCFAFPPDYKAFGKDAPHVRNDEMLKHADLVLAFWDGESRGTKSVIDKACKLGLKVEVIRASPGQADGSIQQPFSNTLPPENDAGSTPC